VRSASSRHQASRTAKQTGRHRAPARIPRNIKIIGVAVPAVVLVGAFVAYQAQPQQPDPVAASVAAAYHSDALLKAAMADGSGTALTTHPAASGQRGTATPAAKPQPSASANLASTPAPKPAASPSPAASHQSSSAELLSAVQTDIANGNDLLAVAQYLAANGYSDAAAAGARSAQPLLTRTSSPATRRRT